MDEVADVTQAAHELYGLTPSEFTAARDARAAELKKAGAVDAAEAVKQLRKPTTAAWVLNLLARRRVDDIDRLVEIGEALRAAQDELAGHELRRLSQERGAVVAELARQAASLAGEAGHPVSGAVLDEVTTSLEAAVADPGVAHALRSGCMATPLERVGFEFDREPGRLRHPPRRAAEEQDRAAGRRARGGSDASSAQMAERMASATRAHDAAARERRSADKALEAVNRRISAAERRMEDLRADHARATERLREAQEREEAARTALARASVESR